MTWIDQLELGLKEDAPYRKDNLPLSQVRGPEVPTRRQAVRWPSSAAVGMESTLIWRLLGRSLVERR